MQAPEPVQIEVKSKNPGLPSPMRIAGDEEEGTLIRNSANSRQNHLQYELIEPVTHVRNRSFFEKLTTSCVNDSRTRLTIAELKSYYKLRVDANTHVGNDIEEHNNLIRELWYLIYKEKLTELKNNGWKVLGFQNIDPRTDFRGGALLSLKNLVYFARNHINSIPNMTEEDNDFLFGIVSINISYFLIKYYHLQDTLDSKLDKADLGSRKALKTFCVLMLQDDDMFNMIHAMLLLDVYQIWLTCRKKWTNLTIMDFTMAMDALKRKYVLATKDRMFKDLNALKTHYCGLPNDIRQDKRGH
jgi:hypothetical protein